MLRPGLVFSKLPRNTEATRAAGGLTPLKTWALWRNAPKPKPSPKKKKEKRKNTLQALPHNDLDNKFRSCTQMILSQFRSCTPCELRSFSSFRLFLGPPPRSRGHRAGEHRRARGGMGDGIAVGKPAAVRCGVEGHFFAERGIT